MYIIMFVLNDSKKLDMILEGWRNVGVKGVTILESIGAYRVRKRIPGRFAFTTANSDENSKTLMAMVEKEEVVQACLNETERLTKLTNSLLSLNNLNTKGMLLHMTDWDINDAARKVSASFEIMHE